MVYYYLKAEMPFDWHRKPHLKKNPGGEQR
jgi:hypothetical protein